MGTRAITIANAKGGEVVHAVYEHPFIVRFCHWVNTVAQFVLVGSGLQIFRAFPSFHAKIPENVLINWPKAYALGGWLGGGLQWHLTFMWIYIATGMLYVAYELFSGNYRQILFFPRDLRGVWPMARHYFFFGKKPPVTEAYNPLQKLAYTSAIGLGVLSVLTGLAVWKPIQFSWGLANGRFPSGAAVALPGDVGDHWLRFWTFSYGGAAWLEQLRFHVDWVEEKPGIHRALTYDACRPGFAG